ncbi:aspartic proteinase Asp1-like [Tripterygium wilfordii]|uniref:aspartic proteinase Asp1-like n=1 Tax=Tripterygium wilfordii TaxID=458696 RepID=UPI0018F81A0E|nr:aspartic proteinase Asp1-like [Tripterygium wilfordii]
MKHNEDWYKPSRDSIVQCEDSLCTVVQENEPNCTNSTYRCKYVIDYKDTLQAMIILSETVCLQLINESAIHYRLAFGCGYQQIGEFKGDEIFGLSMGAEMLIKLLGPTDLIFDERLTQLKGIKFVFDSGASYTYLGQPIYEYTLGQINKNLQGTPSKESEPVGGLPICWRFEKIRIRSFDKIKDYFKKLTLSFTNIYTALLLTPFTFAI